MIVTICVVWSLSESDEPEEPLPETESEDPEAAAEEELEESDEFPKVSAFVSVEEEEAFWI